MTVAAIDRWSIIQRSSSERGKLSPQKGGRRQKTQRVTEKEKAKHPRQNSSTK